MALATAQFGAPGLYSDWGIIGLAQSTNMLETRVWLHPTPAPREGFRHHELSMAASRALARTLALERAALCFSASERSSGMLPKATETIHRIVSAPRTNVIEN